MLAPIWVPWGGGSSASEKDGVLLEGVSPFEGLLTWGGRACRFREPWPLGEAHSWGTLTRAVLCGKPCAGDARAASALPAQGEFCRSSRGWSSGSLLAPGHFCLRNSVSLLDFKKYCFIL